MSFTEKNEYINLFYADGKGTIFQICLMYSVPHELKIIFSRLGKIV